MMTRVALTALLLLGASGCASAKPADPNLTCRLRHPARYVDSLKQLPTAIQIALKKTAGPMADRGEDFNATDVVTKPAPFNRFIRGGQSGGRWFVWYEHGGIAYWRQIVIFALDPNGRGHVLAEQHAAQGDPCPATDQLMGGGSPAH